MVMAGTRDREWFGEEDCFCGTRCFRANTVYNTVQHFGEGSEGRYVRVSDALSNPMVSFGLSIHSSTVRSARPPSAYQHFKKSSKTFRTVRTAGIMDPCIPHNQRLSPIVLT